MEKKRVLLRILVYLIMVMSFMLIIKLKQNIITEKRSQKVISIINEQKDFGKPVEVMKVAKKPFLRVSKITISKIGNDLYEGFVTRDTKNNFVKGQKVFIKPDSEEVFGEILFVNDEIDYDKGLYQIKILCRASGMTAVKEVVFVNYNTIPDALVLPLSCIELEGKNSFVLIVEGETAKKRIIEKYAINMENAAVKGNIKEGDLVVTKGQSLLYEGDRVRIMKGGSK